MWGAPFSKNDRWWTKTTKINKRNSSLSEVMRYCASSPKNRGQFFALLAQHTHKKASSTTRTKSTPTCVREIESEKENDRDARSDDVGTRSIRFGENFCTR